jgi:cobalt-zinc-cadmium efflux system membrane fusion protein
LEIETAQAAAEIAVHKAIQALVNLGLPISRAEVRDLTADQLSRRIQFLGLSPGITAQLDARQTTTNLIPVIAPRNGIVVSRNVVAGEVIDRSETLLTVVDTSEMWLLLDVRLEDAEYVRLGQSVFFHPDGSAYDHVGTVTWISTEVDPETRTVKVRAELPNADRRLRNESFGAGQIILREEQDAIVAPVEAIHWEGCCYVAFVRDKDYFKEGSYTVFHTRMVRPGVTVGSIMEVIAGLLPGEVVVTRGSDVLRAELLKGNLGAG